MYGIGKVQSSPRGRGFASSTSSWCAWKSISWLTNMLAILLCSLSIYQHLSSFLSWTWFERLLWLRLLVHSACIQQRLQYSLMQLWCVTIILCSSLWLEEFIIRKIHFQDLYYKVDTVRLAISQVYKDLKENKDLYTKGYSPIGACGDWYRDVTYSMGSHAVSQ